MFVHGQLDTLVPFEHTIKLKDNCNCPYELLMPEDMDHNNFHYEIDFIYPLKDFLKRHTLFKLGETFEVDFPVDVQEIPQIIKETIRHERSKSQKGAFQNCFGVSNN